MYCTRCGKEINYDSRFCVDCAKQLAYEATLAASRIEAEEKKNADSAAPVAPNSEVALAPAQASAVVEAPAVVAAPAANAPAEPNNGLGKAIAALIMSNVGFFVGYFSIFFAIFAPGLGILMLLGGVALAVVSLIFGIKCIKTFTTFSRAGLKKPVATLVMGIISLATAAVSLLIFMIFFFVIMIAFAELSGGYYY